MKKSILPFQILLLAMVALSSCSAGNRSEVKTFDEPAEEKTNPDASLSDGSHKDENAANIVANIADVVDHEGNILWNSLREEAVRKIVSFVRSHSKSEDIENPELATAKIVDLGKEYTQVVKNALAPLKLSAGRLERTLPAFTALESDSGNAFTYTESLRLALFYMEKTAGTLKALEGERLIKRFNDLTETFRKQGYPKSTCSNFAVAKVLKIKLAKVTELAHAGPEYDTTEN